MACSRRGGGACVLALGLLLARQAAAEEPPPPERTLIVFPLDVHRAEGKLPPQACAAVEEMLREAAASALTGTGWTVLDGKRTSALLRDAGADPVRGDGARSLELARKAGAGALLTGLVLWSDGDLTTSLRLLDARTGRPLVSEGLTGTTAQALRAAFWPKREEYFLQLPLASAGETSAEAGAGALKVVTTPSGAALLLDGRPLGASPIARRVAAGEHEVSFELDGWLPFRRKVTVSAGRPAVMDEPLLRKGGFLQVTLEPRELTFTASISVDGASTGVGLRGPYPAGKRRVRAEAPGYPAVELAVEVPDRGTAPAALVLVPLPGRILVSVNVDATCDIGGAPVQAVAGSVARFDVPGGSTRMVGCSRAGFAEAFAEATPAPGRVARLTLTLARARPTPGFLVEPLSGLEFVRIPAGTKEAQGEEEFYIGRTEITFGAWARCARAGKCPALEGPPTLPATGMSGEAAEKFCYWITGFLPSRAQWLAAAAGRAENVYPWGNAPPNATLANFGQPGGAPKPVGSYPRGATPQGVLDLFGNAAEWITGHADRGQDLAIGGSWSSAKDSWGPFFKPEEHKPPGPDIGARCVLR